MKRGGPIKVDPAKTRAWQARGAKKYADRQRERPRPQSVDNPVDTQKRSGNRKPRRNDAGWRNEVMARCGERCRGCGDRHHVQADHIWPRGQGGPSHVLNGLPLCGEFSRVTPGGCHPAKTESKIVIEYDWLDDEQRAWLAQQGWVAWDDEGEPYGRGRRHFGRRRVPGREIRRVEA